MLVDLVHQLGKAIMYCQLSPVEVLNYQSCPGQYQQIQAPLVDYSVASLLELVAQTLFLEGLDLQWEIEEELGGMDLRADR